MYNIVDVSPFLFVFLTFYNHTHARIIFMILEDTIQRRSKRIRDTLFGVTRRIDRYSYSYLYSYLYSYSYSYSYSWTSMLIFGNVISYGSFQCHPSARSVDPIQFHIHNFLATIDIVLDPHFLFSTLFKSPSFFTIIIHTPLIVV